MTAALAILSWTLSVQAQTPSLPEPSPAADPNPAQAADTSPAALAERLRRLEQINQQLLQKFTNVSEQYERVSRKNEELSRTVEDLSRRLEAAPPSQGSPDQSGAAGRGGPGGGRSGSGIGIGAGAGAGAGGAGDGPSSDFEPALTGGLTSPPVGPEGAPRGRRRNRLGGYYDEDYRERFGYVFQSEDSEYELRINGMVQTDARMYEPQNQVPVVSGFNIPRARMYFSGRLTRPIEYQISFQRTSNNFDLLNAYFNFRYDERLQLRVGRFRAPFTYEWAKLSSWEMLTPERSPFALNFGPNRQIGFMGWGNVLDNRLEYAIGIFDGPRNSYQDFNNAKDVMAFVDYRPFVRTDSPLKYLSLGGSVDEGLQDNPPVPAALRGSANASGYQLTTATGDYLIAPPFLMFNNGVRERGGRELWELHATYFYRGLSVQAAWESGFNDYSLTSGGARPVHLPVSGFYAQAGYILTGETIQKRGLIDPRRPFDLRKGKFGPGAWEAQFRYSELEVGDQVFTSGLADPNLWTNRLNMTDLGLNWYLTRNIKLYFNWQHAMFAQPVYYRPGGFQITNDLYWLRLQLYY